MKQCQQKLPERNIVLSINIGPKAKRLAANTLKIGDKVYVSVVSLWYAIIEDYFTNYLSALASKICIISF
jgi:hypothetical protein